MQKNAPDHFGDDLIRRHEVPKEGGGTTVYPVVDSEEAIAAFANWGVITFHVPPVTIDDEWHPDWVVWDLDPPPGQVDLVREAATATTSHPRTLRDSHRPHDLGIQGVPPPRPIGEDARHRDRRHHGARGRRPRLRRARRADDHRLPQEGARQPGLRRLAAQRPLLHLGGALVAARPSRGTGGHPAHLGAGPRDRPRRNPPRRRHGCRSRPMGRHQARRPHQGRRRPWSKPSPTPGSCSNPSTGFGPRRSCATLCYMDRVGIRELRQNLTVVPAAGRAG